MLRCPSLTPRAQLSTTREAPSHVALQKSRLQSVLQGLRALKSSGGAGLKQWVEPPSPDKAFVSAAEAATLTSDQVAFLERKRKAAAGLGPIMPEGSTCPACNGVGTCTCRLCNGMGVNEKEGEEILGCAEGAQVYERNGLSSSQFFFSKGGPCWLCRGKKEMGCPDCAGTGLLGALEGFHGD